MHDVMRARLTGMLVTAIVLIAGCGDSDSKEDTSESQAKRLAALAHDAWREAKADGTKMDDGPCLGIITEDWVADVAHDPREAVDDERANQCDEYHSGTAHHFVEVTPTGRPFSIDGKRIS
jgi:hypothetical protein